MRCDVPSYIESSCQDLTIQLPEQTTLLIGGDFDKVVKSYTMSLASLAIIDLIHEGK